MRTKKTKIEIRTPQFDRIEEIKNQFTPNDIKEFESYIKNSTWKQFQKDGFCAWDEVPEGEKTLILFPAEWYDKIPDGFIVTDIFGNKEPFIKGKTDNDRRFGCLAYGIEIFI